MRAPAFGRTGIDLSADTLHAPPLSRTVLSRAALSRTHAPSLSRTGPFTHRRFHAPALSRTVAFTYRPFHALTHRRFHAPALHAPPPSHAPSRAGPQLPWHLPEATGRTDHRDERRQAGYRGSPRALTRCRQESVALPTCQDDLRGSPRRGPVSGRRHRKADSGGLPGLDPMGAPRKRARSAGSAPDSPGHEGKIRTSGRAATRTSACRDAGRPSFPVNHFTRSSPAERTCPDRRWTRRPGSVPGRRALTPPGQGLSGAPAGRRAPPAHWWRRAAAVPRMNRPGRTPATCTGWRAGPEHERCARRGGAAHN